MLELPVRPIVTDEGGDIEVYPSVASACLELEPVDVVDGAYEAFDSRGHAWKRAERLDVRSFVEWLREALNPHRGRRRAAGMGEMPG